MTESFLRLARKWPEGAAVAALRDIDAVSHKKHRSACGRINPRFLNSFQVRNTYFLNCTACPAILATSFPPIKKPALSRHFYLVLADYYLLQVTFTLVHPM